MPQPQRQAISDLLKLGVIMSAIIAPAAIINERRNISGPLRFSHPPEAWSSSLRPNGRQANWLIWQQPTRTASPVPVGLPFRIASI